VAQPVAPQHVLSRNGSGEAGDAHAAVHGDRRAEFKADPAKHGTRSETFILVHFGRKLVLIGGTSTPARSRSRSSRCSTTAAAAGRAADALLGQHRREGDTALFFGLSGTGKTTLSSDPERGLIGDDEHGWSDRGVFNFEGGCYAKVIKLSREAEPQIYATTERFGTILENVVIDPSRAPLDLDDASYTENTRGLVSDQLHRQRHSVGAGRSSDNVIMLTATPTACCRRFARLTPEGAMYHFLSGYTARVAGTETGSPSRRRVQHLFRRTVPAAESQRVRQDARRANRQAQREGVAGQYRLDGRPVRRRQPDEDCPHPRDDHGGAHR
jgi:ATP-dependent phosphoenolpyruvate carboxykinase